MRTFNENLMKTPSKRHSILIQWSSFKSLKDKKNHTSRNVD